MVKTQQPIVNPLQATGKKKSGEQPSSSTASSSTSSSTQLTTRQQVAAKGLILVGDTGIDQFDSVWQAMQGKSKKQARRSDAVHVGFDNIATHAAILERQQQSRKAKRWSRKAKR